MGTSMADTDGNSLSSGAGVRFAISGSPFPSPGITTVITSASTDRTFTYGNGIARNQDSNLQPWLTLPRPWAPWRAVCSAPWHSGLSPLDVDAKRKSSRKIWARIATSMLLPSEDARTVLQRMAEPEPFSQRAPVGRRWDRWCPLSQPTASLSQLDRRAD